MGLDAWADICYGTPLPQEHISAYQEWVKAGKAGKDFPVSIGLSNKLLCTDVPEDWIDDPGEWEPWLYVKYSYQLIGGAGTGGFPEEINVDIHPDWNTLLEEAVPGCSPSWFCIPSYM